MAKITKLPNHFLYQRLYINLQVSDMEKNTAVLKNFFFIRSEQGSKLGSSASLKIEDVELERAVKSTGLSSKGPGSNSQHPHSSF